MLSADWLITGTRPCPLTNIPRPAPRQLLVGLFSQAHETCSAEKEETSKSREGAAGVLIISVNIPHELVRCLKS